MPSCQLIRCLATGERSIRPRKVHEYEMMNIDIEIIAHALLALGYFMMFVHQI